MSTTDNLLYLIYDPFSIVRFNCNVKLMWLQMDCGCGTFQVDNLAPLQMFIGGLPERVSEMYTPSFQLLRVVGCHVGKFSEDVEVCSVS